MFTKKLLLSVTLLALYFAMSSAAAVAGTTVPQYAWHTLYGPGTVVHGMDVDTAHNVYVVAESTSSWQGDGGAAPLHPYNNADIAVLKLNKNGAYQWHTFYGSAMGDAGWGIATDADNNVYVTGYSGNTWTGPNGQAPLHAHTPLGDEHVDLFVLKLNSDGAYQWHTFYGPTEFAGDYAVAVANGRVTIAGSSGASWLGDNNAAPLHAYGGSLMALQLDTAGTYQWHTFYGTAGGREEANDIAADAAGNLIVSGASGASWQGDNATAPLHGYSGSLDMVALKLAPNGSYLWHTFYGSVNGPETGNGVALDANGNIYLGGETFDTWQGAGNVAPLHPYTEVDLFVLKLDPNGAYQWHTFYGSTAMDLGYDIAGDGTDVYIAGRSSASWLGDGSAAPLHAFTAYEDIVVLKLNGQGSYQWHTFYGPSNWAFAITTDGPKNIYIGGAGSELDSDNGQPPLHGVQDDNLLVLKLGVYQAPGGVPVQVNPKDKAVVPKLDPKLVWKRVRLTSTYQLKLRESSGKKKMVSDVTVSGLEFHTPVLVNKHTYEWRVRACNVYGCGDWSPWWTFQVLVR